MPINHDMMHAQSPDKVAALKARIEELENENAKLKERLYKTDYHDIQYFCMMYGCRNVEEFHGEIKNLQTKLIATERALWLARNERARVESIYWLNLMYEEEWNAVKFTVKRKHGENVKPGQTTRTPEKWFNIWDVVELYCKVKAEKYK